MSGSSNRSADIIGVVNDLRARVAQLELLGATRWGATDQRYGVHVYRATNQSIAASTVVAISWSTEPYDPFGFFAIGTPTRLVVPVGGAGLYLVELFTQWDSSSTVTEPQVGVHVINAAADNTEHLRGSLINGTTAVNSLRGLVGVASLEEGDQLEGWAFHTTAGARNLQATSDANTQLAPYMKAYRISR